MTRNFLIILSVVFSCTLHLFADTSGYPIGFCNGQWNSRSDIKYSKRDANVSAPLFIPQTLASTVAGNRVESLRLAIASTYNLETPYVWLRTSLNGPDLAVGHASADALSQGWNEVKFETPYNIPTDTQGFYIGYTYKQSHKCGLISALTTPHEGALWIQGPGEDWTDKSNTGTLCIEALVYGDKLPLYNLALTQIIPDNYFIISEKEWSYTATVRNLATATVTSFEIQAEIEGAQTPCLSVVNCNIPLGSEQSFSVTVRPNIENALPANRTVNFKILSVNGNKDEDESDNVNSANISILEKAYIRNVFIEEFTTERCGNCPTAAGYFHEILQNPIYNNKVSMVCHHSGYYTDWLTTDFDEDYMFLYNSDSSYAPAAMLDRTRYADTQSAVFFPENIEFIQDLIDLQLKMPASANIIPSCKLADDNKSVEVTVTGNRVNHTVLEGINITVYLVENEIPAKKQSGAGVGYMQQHVNRLVNSAWGVPVEWDENTFRYNCRFDLNSEWELKNMYVVAILNWYDASNPLKCQVENSGQSLLIPSETSVDNIDIHHEITGIYDVSGMQRSKIGKGVNIVQYSDGSIKKIIK